MRTLISLILNIIWLLTAGWSLFLGYVVAGILACIFIVTIPFGLASFRIAGFVIWPFGREVVDTGRGGAVGAIGNVIWFVIAGWRSEERRVGEECGCWECRVRVSE